MTRDLRAMFVPAPGRGQRYGTRGVTATFRRDVFGRKTRGSNGGVGRLGRALTGARGLARGVGASRRWGPAWGAT